MDQQNSTSDTQPVHAGGQAQSMSRGSTYGIPIAIVFAGMVIASAIIYTSMMKSPVVPQGAAVGEAQVTAEIDVAPVTDKDHIRGNPNAPIVIVEYSDFDCPFCKNFHETMNQIMEDYGLNGNVAWVYRHFPLEQLHPNAHKIAEASECVASLGGNDAFWKFSDLIFGERAVNAPTNMEKLPEYAERSGVSKAKFNECFTSGKFVEQINADVAAAIKTGARGTPYSILIAGDQKGPINGAQPYANVKQMIETLLSQMKDNG